MRKNYQLNDKNSEKTETAVEKKKRRNHRIDGDKKKLEMDKKKTRVNREIKIVVRATE